MEVGIRWVTEYWCNLCRGGSSREVREKGGGSQRWGL